MEDSKQIGKRVKSLREGMDYSQKKMADLLDLKQTTYQTYESGNRTWPIPILVQITTICDTTIDYLITGAEVPKKSGSLDSMGFIELINAIVETNHYNTKQDIGNKLSELYTKQIEELSEERKKRLEVTDEYKDLIQWLKKEFKIKGDFPNT